jgi:membrane dipeptidase
MRSTRSLARTDQPLAEATREIKMDTAVTSHQGLRVPVIDGLNCAVQTREQFQRTLLGRVSAMNMTCLRPPHDLAKAMSDIAKTLRLAAENQDIVEIVTSARAIREAARAGKLGIILGAQNSTCIEHDLSLLRVLQRVGFRILQPTYMTQNLFGSGALVRPQTGLTALGHEWVAMMNELRMLIDLSHVGYQTALEAVKSSKRPVICSHSNPKAICDSPRNIPDELIRAVAKSGGTIGATIFPILVQKDPRPTMADFFRHIDYMVNLVGIDHVAFGSDLTEQTRTKEQWEATSGPKGQYPDMTRDVGSWWTFETRYTIGFESMAHVGRIIDGLATHGYSAAQVDKIMGGNLLRVYEEVWGE